MLFVCRKAANFSLGTFTSSRLSNPRQVLVQDRTPCHADHADDGLQRHTTAAIGLLKAIYPPNVSGLPKEQEVSKTSESTTENLYKSDSVSGRIIKDVVAFDPRHYWDLVERLSLDIMEPPVSQVLIAPTHYCASIDVSCQQIALFCGHSNSVPLHVLSMD